MKFKLFLLIIIFFSCLFSVRICLSNNQKGPLLKMKNGETFSIGLNKSAVIKNIWKDSSLNDWSIKIEALLIEKDGIKIRINSSTFLGNDFTETKLIRIGEVVTIIQSEEVVTKVKLEKIAKDNIILSLKIESAPPAPELQELFDIEIK